MLIIRSALRLGLDIPLRLLATNTSFRGGPSQLEEVIENLKKRGLKENGNISVRNIFDLFQVEQKITLSQRKLKREYTMIQRSVHPDRFVNSSTDIQDKVLKLSTLVNDAYETLRHPYKRAKYLLSLTMSKSQDELDNSLDSLKLDSEFLSRMMQLREQVELSGDPTQLMRLSAEVDDELTRLLIQMNENFSKKNTSALLEQLAKLKFLGNLHVTLAERTEGFSSF